MMRRFSRRRRPGAGDAAINAERVFAQILEQDMLDLTRLDAMPASEIEEIPDSYAAIGQGEDKNGRAVLVSFAPRSAGDALLAALIAWSKMSGESPFDGDVIVVSPNWNQSARRRLALVPSSVSSLRAVAAPGLADTPVEITPLHVREPGVLSVEAVIAQVANPADRDLFARAAAALDGLASKHGGAVRGFGRSVELVLMARRVAELRADDTGVVLDTILPARSTARLSADSLASTLDALEGNLRKRLNDRRTRDGDEGIRSRLQPLIARALDLRALVHWPVGGKDLDVIDSVGVNNAGIPVATAARGSLSLAALGVILDAALEIRSALPVLLAGAPAPVRLDGFRLALVAREFAPGVAKLLPLLNLSHDLLEIRDGGRAGGLEVAICGSGEALPIATGRGRRGRDDARKGRARRNVDGGAAEARAGAAGGEEAQAESETEETAATPGADDANNEREERGGRSRRRGRRGRGGDRANGGEGEGEGAAAADAGSGAAAEPARRARPRFEEMSTFDLAEESSDDDEDDGRGRRRGRRSRGRKRRDEGAEVETPGREGPRGRTANESLPARAAASHDAANANANANANAKDNDDDDDDDVVDDDVLLEQSLSELPIDADDDDAEVIPYDEEEEAESPAHNRDKRRRSRKPERAPEEAEPEPPKQPRRRVAIVAHADRDSLLSAVLLARELRLLEGIWVYTQAELMSFFRGGATDLREDTPIYMIGFTPSPARDVIQAAAIYAGRLTWIDHRAWPPEDLGELKQTLGEDHVLVAPGVESSLPLMLENFTRRSRFSDKLVDLAAGRFTEHDFERWGRVWWHRLGEFAKQTGARRQDLEPLLAGRPSDLAKEAAKAEVPPPPPEVEFVGKQDFRLVHFAGQSMVILEVPAELDLNLAARIARERYSASLSLALRAEGELGVVSGDDATGKRTLDFGSMVDHLADKLEWVESLPDHDHVARMTLHGRLQNPERLDEVISEIVMGRTLLDR